MENIIVVMMLVLSILLSIYSLIIFIRIIFTWIPVIQASAEMAKIIHFLAKLTDPYLNMFRNIVRVGRIDFSPVIGVGILSIVNNIVRNIAYTGKFSLSATLGLLVGGILNFVIFILVFFIILCVVRIIYLQLKGSMSSSPYLMAIDTVLQPLIYRLSKWIFRTREYSYTIALITGGIHFLLMIVIIAFIRGWLIRVLYSIPF